ncbi:MAG: hypothetical protein IAB99_08550 [Bacteroidetes bacterium]|uniref:Uncharacterized protein n=1 Tax=Candidatus Cryptobacteroides faecipullorum TaxID=2840764 RepID=A0A9D9NBM4_9BACT|nr:hypothetical protein [Candidatus Cryptobacteroides faecipullorum]
MASGMAAWEHWHTCWRGGKEKGKSVGWRDAPRGKTKRRRYGKEESNAFVPP